MDPRELPKKLIDSATSKIDEVVRSPETAKRVSDLEERYADRRRETKLEEGTLRGIRVIVHRGWVARGVARLHVRVVESPKLPDEGSRIPYWDVLNANLRRHATLAFPDVHVTATIGDATASSVTDRHGYAAISVDVPELPPGWHAVSVTAGDEDHPDLFSGSGRVFQPDPKARFHVVSDIDDTVIRTGLEEGFTALRRTLFGDAHTRRAVPGMASLYRGLERGTRTPKGKAPPERGFFYVSTGSWSFYEMLTQFLQLRGYPRGPLFLTSWGPSDRYIRRSGAEHKKQALRRLAEGYPGTPLVLIGDSGQQDAEIYLEFAKANRTAVAVIVIMKASDASPEKLRELQARGAGWRADGLPFYVAEDAREAAEVFFGLGLCDDITLEEVDTELGARF